MVFVAAQDLIVGHGTRYAGCRVPEAAEWNPHTLKLHIANGSLRDVSDEEADRMYEQARERVRDQMLRVAEKNLVKAERRHNEASAALKIAEERYEMAMGAAEEATSVLAALKTEIAALKSGPLPELGPAGPSERKKAKEQARIDAEAEAKAKAEAAAAKATEAEDRKARKEAARAKRKKRREDLAELTPKELRDLADKEKIEDLPRKKADMVAHIASELDRREVIAKAETGANG
jgi:colicin import membrane protein